MYFLFYMVFLMHSQNSTDESKQEKCRLENKLRGSPEKMVMWSSMFLQYRCISFFFSFEAIPIWIYILLVSGNVE